MGEDEDSEIDIHREYHGPVYHVEDELEREHTPAFLFPFSVFDQDDVKSPEAAVSPDIVSPNLEQSVTTVIDDEKSVSSEHYEDEQEEFTTMEGKEGVTMTQSVRKPDIPILRTSSLFS